jgi:hypothetical protein
VSKQYLIRFIFFILNMFLILIIFSFFQLKIREISVLVVLYYFSFQLNNKNNKKNKKIYSNIIIFFLKKKQSHRKCR